jgi:bacillithiol system protein YtxJ
MSKLTKLSGMDELEGWLERSRSEPVWIFKHSLTCPTSAAALEEYRAFAGEAGAKGHALIEVQTSRRLSDELARRTGIRHESPQAMLLRDGKAVWHASHWRIRADRLRRQAAAPA